MLETAQTIIGLTCSRSKIVHLPLLPEDDPKQRCPDISAAEHSLGWKPAVSLEEGFARTIKYFEETIGKTQTGHRMSITANVGLTEGPR